MSEPAGETIALVEQLCSPPGTGWASSSTGIAPLARGLHHARYGTTDPNTVRRMWLEAARSSAATVNLLGTPYAGGSYGIASSGSGPLGIRVALDDDTANQVRDLGDVRFLPGAPTDDMLATRWLERIRQARFGDANSRMPVSMLSVAETITNASAREGVPLLTLGGDHSVSAAAIRGFAHRGLGLVHVDAHGDLSTGRDGLVLLHSSWIHAADRDANFGAVVQVGVQDGSALPPWLIDRAERISPSALQRHPEGEALRALTCLADRGCTRGYLSIDIDCLRVEEAPATGLPDGILQLEWLTTFIRSLADTPNDICWLGADVTEVAPAMTGINTSEAETTCQSAAALVQQIVPLLAS